jgi:molecular chaperone DnaK (HSP70)
MKNSVKVPSQILYKDETIRWGFDIPLGEKPLQWFKVFLLQEEDMRQPFMDEKFRDWLSFREAREQLKGLKKTAADVVADYLKLLWQWVIDDMGKIIGEAAVAAFPFRVVITCPAIWPLYAQSRIRQAAEAAGILDHRVGGETVLDLLPEPEAAVLSIMEDFYGEPVEVGEKHMPIRI